MCEITHPRLQAQTCKSILNVLLIAIICSSWTGLFAESIGDSMVTSHTASHHGRQAEAVGKTLLACKLNVNVFCQDSFHVCFHSLYHDYALYCCGIC